VFVSACDETFYNTSQYCMQVKWYSIGYYFSHNYSSNWSKYYRRIFISKLKFHIEICSSNALERYIYPYIYHLPVIICL